MPFFKKLLIGLAALVVVAAAIVSAVFYFTGGMTDSATEFFATAASSGAPAAYGKASPAFRQAVSESDFEAIVDRLGLTRFKSASWPSREMQNGQGKVVGTLTLEGGVTLPATVNLVKNEAGQWQVFNFEVTPAGANPGETQKSAQPPKIESSAQASDSVDARIGEKNWSSSGTSMIAIELGNIVLVQTAPSVKSGDIELTTLKLQFDETSTKPQVLGRECSTNGPCIELTDGGHEFLIDRASKEPAVLRITKAEGGSVEGTFSADMESLDGKVAIRDGHFHVTLKR